MARLLRVLITAESATFFIGAVLHAGVQVQLGFAVLAEPRIVPATIVEASAGCALAVAAFGLFARRPWAWSVTVAAQILALAGVFLGMAALAAGRGPRTMSNDVYHRVMVCTLLAGLAISMSRRSRVEVPQ